MLFELDLPGERYFPQLPPSSLPIIFFITIDPFIIISQIMIFLNTFGEI